MERLTNISVAYTKGVKAHRQRIKQCPYGETKKELREYWHYGKEDARNNSIDRTLYKE